MAEREPNIPRVVPGADRGAPSMAPVSDRPSEQNYTSRLRQLAERQGSAGGDPDTQSAQLVMSGAEMLMQAAQVNPTLAPIVTQAVTVLRNGIMQLSQGFGAPPTAMRRPQKRSAKMQMPAEEEEEF